MHNDSAPPNPAERPPRRKRRWWVYVLAAFGACLVLAVIGFLILAGYYHSLIKTYTSQQPLKLDLIEAAPAERDRLIANWQKFHQDVLAGKPSAPFKLSAPDLQVLVAGVPKIKDRVRVSFVDGRIRAEFSVPLDQPHKRELQGRYLNGSALLDVKLAPDGFPVLQVVSLEANGEPAPGWLAGRIKKMNLLQDVYRNPHAVELLSGIGDIAVTDDHLVITPLASKGSLE